jgi:hypothetical protein
VELLSVGIVQIGPTTADGARLASRNLASPAPAHRCGGLLDRGAKAPGMAESAGRGYSHSIVAGGLLEMS